MLPKIEKAYSKLKECVYQKGKVLLFPRDQIKCNQNHQTSKTKVYN
jgi:hypothetical protein